jgi:hypothetical protein
LFARTNDVSLRDWFAGMATAGILSGQLAPHESAPDSPEQAAARVAEQAYRIADALLAQRGKPAQPTP